jgi:hypothetical protein
MLIRREAFAVRNSLHGMSLAEVETTDTPRKAATKIVKAMHLRLGIKSFGHFVDRNVPSIERAATAARALPPAA